jgi:hypothetical protein
MRRGRQDKCIGGKFVLVSPFLSTLEKEVSLGEVMSGVFL